MSAEKKFTEGQKIWVSGTYEGVSPSGLMHNVILGEVKMRVSDKDVCGSYAATATYPTEPDTELSDILHTSKSPKREFVERVAPAFFQAMVSDPKENVAYVETAVEKAAKMWDYIQSLNY